MKTLTNKESEIAKRLGEWIESNKISYYAFENKISASRGSISKAVKERKSFGTLVLEKILSNYPEIDPLWLVTGKTMTSNPILKKVEGN